MRRGHHIKGADQHRASNRRPSANLGHHDEESPTSKSDFCEFQQIGKGSFGVVFRCVRKIDSRQFALKEISGHLRSQGQRRRALKEIYALATQADNPHVVRYFDAWEEGGRLLILTELCAGGTLADRWSAAGPLPQGMLLDVLAQVSAGLDFLHDRCGMVHLDIKPENLYVKGNGLYKLGDFGLACVADRGDLADEGDRRYLSREALEHEERCDLRKVDVFALGASLLELASRSPLPAGGAEYHALREGRLPSLEGAGPALQGLVAAMMCADPAARPSAKDLRRHPLLLAAAPALPGLGAAGAGAGAGPESSSPSSSSPPPPRGAAWSRRKRLVSCVPAMQAHGASREAWEEVKRLRAQLEEVTEEVEALEALRGAGVTSFPTASSGFLAL